MEWNGEKEKAHTEDDTNQGEDDELGDNQKREIARNDRTIQPRLRLRALVLRQPPHNDREEEPKQGGHRGREHTRNEGERARRRVRPFLQERNEGRQGRQVGQDGDDEERERVEEADREQEGPPDGLLARERGGGLVEVLPDLSR